MTDQKEPRPPMTDNEKSFYDNLIIAATLAFIGFAVISCVRDYTYTTDFVQALEKCGEIKPPIYSEHVGNNRSVERQLTAEEHKFHMEGVITCRDKIIEAYKPTLAATPEKKNLLWKLVN